jgi:endonuclease YncB( thermonuclease family)
MFRWRKKQEGFEWHQYVRTTIKLRRDARRERIHKFKQSAVDGARAAGDAAGAMAKEGAKQFAAGAKQAGEAAGAAAMSGAEQFAAGAKVAGAAAGSMAVAGARGFAIAARAGAISLFWNTVSLCAATARLTGGLLTGAASGLGSAARSESARPLLDVLARPGVSTPLAIAGGIALFAGIGRVVIGGALDRDAAIAMLLGLICLALWYGPRTLLGMAPARPRWLANVPDRTLRGGVVAGTVAVLALAGWALMPRGLSLPGPSQLATLSFGSSASTVEGRGNALSGDTLRIGSTVVRLAGIEAPEAEQRCQRPGNRRWRCAEAAYDALSRLIRGRVVKCEVKEKGPGGRVHATCSAGGADLAAMLVKDGHVFAEHGLMARYASLETDAKSARNGIWNGEAERPKDFRARTWEEAKRSAPEGCPIKGQAAGGARVYVLPWSADYARVRVSRARGDRWFCTEQEAQSAGWRPTDRS